MEQELQVSSNETECEALWPLQIVFPKFLQRLLLFGSENDRHRWNEVIIKAVGIKYVHHYYTTDGPVIG